MSLTEMTRRSFTKLTAFAVAAAAAGISADAIQATDKAYASEDEVVEQKTFCSACPRTCACVATIRNGVVERIYGSKEACLENGHLCAKGLSGVQALYHPNRTKYPLKRVGERGVDNTWERISWDEAVDMVAGALDNMAKKTGRNGMLVTCGGGGNPNFSDTLGFMYYWGAGNTFEPGASQCSMPRAFIGRTMLGTVRPAGIGDFDGINMFNPKAPSPCLVIWGAGTASSNPVQVGSRIIRMHELGSKIIVVDPRFSTDAARADVWLPVRAGTDACMMNAWIKWMIDNNKYDKEFVTKWSNGPCLVNADDNNLTLLRASTVEGMDVSNGETYVYYDQKKQAVTRMFPLGPSNEADYNPVLEGYYEVKLKDGRTITCKTAFTALREHVEPFTLEKASEVCSSPLKNIEAALELFGNAGEGRSLCDGVTLDQNLNSADNSLALSILNVLVGATYKPGSGCMDNAEFDGKTARYKWGRPKGIFANMGRAVRGWFNPNVDKDGNPKRYKYDSYGKERPLAADGLPEPFEYYNYQSAVERIGYIEHKGLGHWAQCQNGELTKTMVTGDPYPIKVWIERSGNKFCTTSGSAGWLAGIKNLDFVAHHYMYPTSFTFEAADVMLPTSEWLEMDYRSNSHANIMGLRISCVNLFEHVDDRFIYGSYFKRLADGYHDERAYHVFYDDNEYYCNSMADQDAYHEDLRATDNQTGKKLTWEETKALGFYAECTEDELWSLPEKGYYLNERVGTDGLYKGFVEDWASAPLNYPDIKEHPRKQNVFNDFVVWLGRKGHDPWGVLPPVSEDYSPLPVYREPHDSDDPEIKAKYPLFLSEGRIPYFHHGTLRNAPFLREVYPAPEIWIDPEAAETRGIKTGDWVNIKSVRCEQYEEIANGIFAVAWVTEGITPGCCYMERFWNPEFLEKGQDARKSWTTCNVNVLTSREGPFNPIIGSMTYRGIGVEVSKAERPDGLWYEPEDFEPWMPQASENTGGGYTR